MEPNGWSTIPTAAAPFDYWNSATAAAFALPFGAAPPLFDPLAAVQLPPMKMEPSSVKHEVSRAFCAIVARSSKIGGCERRFGVTCRVV